MVLAGTTEGKNEKNNYYSNRISIYGVAARGAHGWRRRRAVDGEAFGSGEGAGVGCETECGWGEGLEVVAGCEGGGEGRIQNSLCREFDVRNGDYDEDREWRCFGRELLF